MTTSYPLSYSLSANDLFKQRYTTYLRWSVLAALALTALLVWLMPSYRPAPYSLRQKVIHVLPPLPEDIEVPKEKPIIAPPVVREIEPTDDPNAPDVEVPENILIEVYVPPTQVANTTETEFIASSQNPRLLHQPRPQYPEILRMARIQGSVEVNVLVGPNGLVEQAVLVRGVHPTLDQAALKAAKRCRFEPGLQRGFPVRAWITVPYNFHLNR